MLNNRGITTVEVLICFTLVTIISASLFDIVTAFNEKRIEETNRSKVITYSNTLTRVIQRDFIADGIDNAKITDEKNGSTRIITVDVVLKSKEERKLIVQQRFTKSSIHLDGDINQDDYFLISYGTPDKLIDYALPELGETLGRYDNNFKTFTPCKGEDKTNCRILKDLEINNILVNISNELSSDNVDSQVLNIYIGFYHPNLSNKYAINIVSPINYPELPATKTNDFLS